jgi:hypothetical protein
MREWCMELGEVDTLSESPSCLVGTDSRKKLHLHFKNQEKGQVSR